MNHLVPLERLRERRSAKWTLYEPDVLPAFVAESDFALAAPIRAALAAAVAADDTGYANPAATRLGAELAGFAQRRMGWSIDPDAVITCMDVVAGLTDLLRTITAPGDGAIVTPPVYHPFFSLVPEAGRRLVEVPLLGGRELDLDGIERELASGSRAVLLCNPHNPTGRVVPREQLERLAAMAAAHDAWILSDEIHAPLTLPGAEHVPFTTVSDEAAARGIVLVSASKAFNLAGLGCAQIITAPGPAREAAEGLSFFARHCGHLGAIAAEAAYAAGDQWLDDVIATVDGNRHLLGELLAERLPDAGYVEPEAGYLTWIDLGAYDLGPDPAAVILERGRLALSPGTQFGRGGEGYVRYNAGTSPELLTEAVERLARGVRG
ncbi:MAG: aminotransferase class I/II-fold pyridoxal phosphate-dependent enzyme [Solirubrobacterales bacterium]|nr:aminotransferase class I/II-fold pyridoxal phosphate-dependent enzyme [Solirubrobacterales bacterium]MCB8971102.1 aminotransferase class I/II-fold pyridoxal phosphate-dependent enzyme [Thermoleophilales bacterium]MCO5327900.1 aminotransferase class I/II-fold pyridoxal phosphate-dependent enzyme [Solirubrobacterales bacterium]